MRNIVRCDENDYETLVGIWERSVHATHDFISEEVFEEIKSALIPDYFPEVDLYAIIDNDSFAGFIGLSADRIEMLFIDSCSRGKGLGTSLMDFAKNKGATRVDVNEQNQSALYFYKAKGFHMTGRDETDDAGRPYPVLHLSLNDKDAGGSQNNQP